ncbi:uncharacterized protein LY89DRAFT_361654 [Mollisia scopiformis]|uniref:Uncharacterized protein n=1 Tax=Mollisia scopiformis TaxID=149040 RepID=A0A132B5W7_MOLSC|nr:uncharacterized protein LY89DRAFT_361654 [Mollisia scopiformis]KUJ07284.1 hypothetical protein LY89DRAFT_361654 [Mollisia scopiformis]
MRPIQASFRHKCIAGSMNSKVRPYLLCVLMEYIMELQSLMKMLSPCGISDLPVFESAYCAPIPGCFYTLMHLRHLRINHSRTGRSLVALVRGTLLQEQPGYPDYFVDALYYLALGGQQRLTTLGPDVADRSCVPEVNLLYHFTRMISNEGS